MGGMCPFPVLETCTSHTSQCYTAFSTFPALSNFHGFNTQGCLNDTRSCNTTIGTSFLNAYYNTTTTCCTTSYCNPIQIPTSSSPARVTMSIQPCCSRPRCSVGKNSRSGQNRGQTKTKTQRETQSAVNETLHRPGAQQVKSMSGISNCSKNQNDKEVYVSPPLSSPPLTCLLE
ncbi:hypothetical protein Q5P01_018493 [Channa striata]|uniref:UPAR/Ly6 domain-containing protein n=1 Tax=Channa striata TaxID=64152 RepID=A0AA88M7S9_CHASR|nr:hypothetical protein Q5P01_018493 [Channa striata]